MLTVYQKATPPLVIAQSYQMGPSVKIDPLTMLGDAKRLCDSLVNLSTLTMRDTCPNRLLARESISADDESPAAYVPPNV